MCNQESSFNLTSKGMRNKSSQCHTQQLCFLKAKYIKCIVETDTPSWMMLWIGPFSVIFTLSGYIIRIHLEKK